MTAPGHASLVRRVVHDPGRRTLRVNRVVELSATMRRVVLGGGDLETDFPFLALAAADHVKLELPHEGAVVTRDYTPRAYDPAAGELTVDFVVHAHGPAGRWGAAAAPGAQLRVLGPRGSQVYPVLPHYVLVADETGLPALERFLEELPPTTRVDAVALTPGRAHRTLPDHPGLHLTWVDARLDTAAADVTALVTTIDLTPDSFVWGGAEAGVMRAVRTQVRRHPAMTADRVAVRGYWRVGVAGSLPAD